MPNSKVVNGPTTTESSTSNTTTVIDPLQPSSIPSILVIALNGGGAELAMAEEEHRLLQQLNDFTVSKHRSMGGLWDGNSETLDYLNMKKFKLYDV